MASIIKKTATKQRAAKKANPATRKNASQAQPTFRSYYRPVYRFPVGADGDVARAASRYEHLTVGDEGADLAFGNAMRAVPDLIERGESVAGRLPQRVVASMVPPRNRKKVCDLMKAQGCLIVSERVKHVLEDGAGDGVEFFPTTILDHAKKAAAGTFFLVNVIRLLPYFDLEKSQIERYSGKLWSIESLVVRHSPTSDTPPMFRLGPDARYNWYFIRRDIADKLQAMRASGWRSTAASTLAAPEDHRVSSL